MNKINIKKGIITSLVTLIPILAGILLWEKLPEQMPIHWGVNGEADGFAGRGFAVFVLPLILLVLHWLCIIATMLDPKNKFQSKKVSGMVYWIAPILSMLVNGATYVYSMGKPLDMIMIVMLIAGLLFVILGNYMPKCRPNHTIGFRIAWTLNDERNWNATHRLGGKVMVIGGLLLIGGAFLPKPVNVILTLIVIVAGVLVPVVYSYVYYKKHDMEEKDGSDK